MDLKLVSSYDRQVAEEKMLFGFFHSGLARKPGC